MVRVTSRSTGTISAHKNSAAAPAASVVKGTNLLLLGSRMRARLLRAIAAVIIGSTLITAHAEGQRAVTTPLAFVPGRLLVQPRAGLEPRDFDAIIRPHGGRRLHTIPQINVHVIEV